MATDKSQNVNHMKNIQRVSVMLANNRVTAHEAPRGGMSWIFPHPPLSHTHTHTCMCGAVYNISIHTKHTY